MRAISTFNLERGTSTFWCRALIALRTRVRKSATGSVKLMLAISSNRRPLASRVRPCPTGGMSARERTSRDGLTGSASLQAGLPPLTSTFSERTLVREGNYQDDFETPGISPLSARPRKHRRQTPNLRRNARGRPQMWQRLCWRLENLGFLFALAILDVLAIVSFTQSLRSCSSKPLLLRGAERHAHVLQQRTCLVVVARRGHNRDVHSPHLLDLRVIDFREDQLVAHAQREIAASIERLGRHAAEVTHAGQSNVHQPVEELVHTVAAQGHHH